MNPFRISIVLSFLLFLGSTTDPTPFTGDVSINCGSAGAYTARNGRQWLGDDVHPQLSSFLQLQGSSTASIAAHKLTSATDPVPHKTARLSRSQFSYVFRPNPGQKIIRLHFYHASYKGFKGSKDLFSVEAGHFTLLSNFSASLTAVAIGVNSFTKEFVLAVRENQPLTITFSPETSPSKDTHAFINGIEFVPVPPRLSYFGGGDAGLQLQVFGQNCAVYVDDGTAIEIVHRLNIEDDLVPPAGDFGSLFPKWATQRDEKVHNKTWKLPVEVGFKYLIRLHFSEAGLEKASADAMFKVLVNEMVARSNTELVKEKQENNLPLYMDYLVVMRGHKQEGKRDISISLQSHDSHGFLAGFEILKLSNPDDSLASPNPLPPLQGSSTQTIQILLWVLGHRNASGTALVIVISLLSITVHKLRELREDGSIEDEHRLSARAERLLRSFSLAEIELATRNFSNGLLIGRGGFGKVYKGIIDEGQKTVAVKRLNSNSQQGAQEFWTEVEVLSELRHINIISLIGYCNEHKEKILVYEYMPCGTLADHLYRYARDNLNHPSLTWKQCLKICIGAARGLDYLHTGHGVIHRDVKASNILLDESFRPKLSDFGLAKHENEDELQSHVSTKVKGTNGYLDPHYFQTSKLTRKSDTYAFGVVLLATLCGRPAVDVYAAEDERVLINWAKDKISKGETDQIVASSLKEEISSNSLRAFAEVAERCLDDEPNNRPTMSQVVTQLEFALQQQDINQNQEINEVTRAYDDPPPTSSDGTDLAMQNPTLPPNQQDPAKVGNDELTSGRKHGRTTRSISPSRLMTFWKMVKSSKKNAPVLSETPKLETIKEERYEKTGAEFSNGVEPSKKNAVALSKTAMMEITKEKRYEKTGSEFSNRVEPSKKNAVLSETAMMEVTKEERYEKTGTEFSNRVEPSKKNAVALSITAMMEVTKEKRYEKTGAKFSSRVEPSKKNAVALSKTAMMEVTKEKRYEKTGTEFSNRVEPSKKNAVALSKTAMMEVTKEQRYEKTGAKFSSRVEPSKKNAVALSKTAMMEVTNEEKYQTGAEFSNRVELALSKTTMMEVTKGKKISTAFQDRNAAAAAIHLSPLNKSTRGASARGTEAKLSTRKSLEGLKNEVPLHHSLHHHSSKFVFVNEKPLRAEELLLLKNCSNPPKKLRPGRYWYDKLYGYWGKEGEKPLQLISPHLAIGGSQIGLKANNGDTNTRLSKNILSTTRGHVVAGQSSVKMLEKPSPMSVHDNSFYCKDPSSPVKKMSTAFQEVRYGSKRRHHLMDWTRMKHSFKYDQKFENMRRSVDELTQLNKEPHGTVANHNESLNPVYKYIHKILLTAGLLNDSSVTSMIDKLLSSPHLIDADMFHFLEKREDIQEAVNGAVETSDKLKLDKRIQRKMIFDLVDEILVRITVSSRFPAKGKKQTSPYGLLKEIHMEVYRLSRMPNCIDEVLAADLKHQSEDWVDYSGEVPALVLDIESLIFKDLINEVIMDAP